MSRTTANTTTGFSVVGAAYVPEHHSEGHSLFEGSKRQGEPSTFTSCLVLTALILGITMFAAEVSVFASDAPNVLQLVPPMLW